MQQMIAHGEELYQVAEIGSNAVLLTYFFAHL